jgi:hypothetical protein
MLYSHKLRRVLPIMGSLGVLASTALGFEGRLRALMIRGPETNALLYTVGTNSLRVEMAATNWPNPVDILDRNTRELTLLFPNNRSFVRLAESGGASASSRVPAVATPAGAVPMLAPQSIGPTNLRGIPAPPPISAMSNAPPGVGPQSAPHPPAMPAMPMIPGPMMEKMELQQTGQKTNLFGFACEQYEIKQRGQTMQIWATDQLFPFQPYVQNQPHRFGPRMIEERWTELLKARKLFPLLVTLRFDNAVERFRFEVQSITPEKLKDEDASLFKPPTNYFEIQPLPF